MTGLVTGNGLPSVVVTGVAMSTALATDADTTWKKLLDGQSGIRKLEDPFVVEYNLPVRIGGHLLEDFNCDLTRVERRRLSYLQAMSTVLGRRVWTEAGSPDVDPGPPWRVQHVRIPKLDISSSDLRARAADGRPLEHLVPLPAIACIRERGLYAVGR